jgi:D-ribose pyranose/furanose isomerase RbsD
MRFFHHLLLLLCLALPCNAYADMAMQKETQVIVNLLKYIRGVATTDIGLVYDPALPASKHEAESLAQSLGNGYRPTLVDVNALTQNAQIKLIILTNGLSAHFNSIASQTRQQHIFTLSIDTKCAEHNCCVLSIDTSSGIEIFLNETLLRELGFDVDAALRFMVKRV